MDVLLLSFLFCKDLRKFCAHDALYGKDSGLLGVLAYNCGPGVGNKSTVLKKLKRGDRTSSSPHLPLPL
ncbi:hypothetical protein [Duncaniella freteri]|uniref:hypothetical protein n=1 Tax=Duncaniella freteri TaxID=2530391 RepID=UPI0025728F65|nr:hypothetical protein [Duncaniella freteri]